MPGRADRLPAPEEAFFSALATGRAVHAYLVLGPQGSGKGTFAARAAKALLCTQRLPSGEACGGCPACARVRAGSHPDLLHLRAGKASIGVDEVRALLAELANRPFEGGFRAVILHDADKMTPQAQNALLKSIEEPIGDTVFFLLVTDLRQMLLTVRSRCRMVRMVAAEDIARRLVELGADENYARELEALSGGAWERAKELYASEAFFAARGKARAMLDMTGMAQVPIVFAQVKDEKDAARDILLWMECLATDLLRVLGGATPKMPGTARDARRFTLPRARCIMEEIMRVRKRMASNVAWQNAMEPLLYSIAEGETK